MINRALYAAPKVNVWCLIKWVAPNSISVGYARLDERESFESRPGGKTRQLVAPNCSWPATELEWPMGELFVLLKESKEKS